MRKHIYVDESGNFDFSLNAKASRYFILTTVSTENHGIASDLLDLRRELAWNGVRMPREFHATEDKQLVRDKVFDVLSKHDFRVDATLLEKRKAHPKIRPSAERFYKYAWYYHMKHVAPRIATRVDELLVIGASIGTRRKLYIIQSAIEDVMRQTSPTSAMESTVWPVSVDPMLQVADYCSWAIQRKWEVKDWRSYDLISDKIRTEYDLFRVGTTLYY
jgi:hypothetical protein